MGFSQWAEDAEYGSLTFDLHFLLQNTSMQELNNHPFREAMMQARETSCRRKQSWEAEKGGIY